jgi:hypothetical protein
MVLQVVQMKKMTTNAIRPLLTLLNHTCGNMRRLRGSQISNHLTNSEKELTNHCSRIDILAADRAV